jgi:2,4'-dihydroxyacetophenone dioxygenase
MNDPRKVPYAKPQPWGMQADIFTPGALDLDGGLWIPQAEGVDFRPLLLNTSQGYYVNLLRVRKAGVLSRHRHSGPVHAVTLRGRWHYLEHDWKLCRGPMPLSRPGRRIHWSCPRMWPK